MKAQTRNYLLIGGGLFLAYQAYKSFNPNWVNPTSDENVANQAFEGFYQATTGSKGTPGTDLSWLINETDHVDPTSRDNVANTTFNRVYKWATGSEGSLGTDLAKLLNE